MVEEQDLNRNGNNVAGIFVPAAEAESETSIFDTGHAEPLSDTADTHRPEVAVEDRGDLLQEVEAERGATKSNRGRRTLVAFILLAVVVTAGLCAFFLAGSGATRKARVPVNKNTSNSDGEDAATRQAIEQLTGTAPGVAMGDGSVVRPLSSPGASPAQNAVTQTQQPVTQLADQTNGNLTQTAGPDKSISNSSAAADATGPASVVRQLAPGRNSERSVRIGDEIVAPPPARKDPDSRSGKSASAPSVAIPTFGSMLPVKSLGVIYSLRSGALARFELTRDVKGKGWSLPHGTVLVAALRGSEYNRAFISLVGFIDSESGKFVQVGGDLLGADGGAGIKGNRRQMSSSWSKVFRKLGEAGLNIAGRAVSSVGRGPIIITDAYGQSAAQFGNEFNGVLSTKERDSFVEIPAGTSCYVMITDLPEKVHGVDALSQLSRTDLEEKANADERREATGISEHELAELIQSGDVPRIKAALPRMTPEMRRVAEAVIAEGNDR